MKKTTTVLITILVLALIIITAVWLNKHNMAVAPVEVITQSPIVIIDTPIEEANFSGSRPVMTGSSVVVLSANEYLNTEIAAFKASADKEVPDIRKEFGNDAPPANYTIDFKAKHVVSPTTDSIVIDGYRYTGGANGMSFYKVFTAKRDGEQLLALRDVVRPEQQEAFAAYVRNEIIARQEAIFQDDVNKLTFDSFKNFSLEENTLTLYFDKYEIGPGALGAVAFPLERSVIEQYVTL